MRGLKYFLLKADTPSCTKYVKFYIMPNRYKIDDNRSTLWDLLEGVIYHIIKENDDYILISHNQHVGLYSKKKENIIIPAKYDAIGGPFPGSIPNETFGNPKPFELHLDNCIGIGSINGVQLDTLIDENEYRVYPETFSEDIVVVELASDELSLHPTYHFLDTRNGHLSGLAFSEIRSPFKNGEATVSNGRLIMDVNLGFEVIRDYPAYFIGFNDEIYLM